jgi:hypothetical protein
MTSDITDAMAERAAHTILALALAAADEPHTAADVEREWADCNDDDRNELLAGARAIVDAVLAGGRWSTRYQDNPNPDSPTWSTVRMPRHTHRQEIWYSDPQPLPETEAS